MKGTLIYNESKVKKGVASVIGFSGLPKADPAFTRLIFGRLENANIRTENLSFQLSINPDPERNGESLTDQEAVSLAMEIMQKMGYGNQPIVIYKHQDIDRTHYHVVSCRVAKDGKKISDKFEKKRINKIVENLSDKYHYTLGNNKNNKVTEKQKDQTRVATAPILAPSMDSMSVMDPMYYIEDPVSDSEPDYSEMYMAEKPAQDALKKAVPAPVREVRFDARKGKIKQQYYDVFNEACKYHFTTFNQFAAICESMNVNVTEYTGAKQIRLRFQGLNDDGEKTNTPITEKQLGHDYHKQMEEQMKRNVEQAQGNKAATKPDRARIGRMASFFLDVSRSQRHFEKMMQKKGLYPCFSFNIKNELFGVTIIDKRTKKAYKGSDLLPPLRAEAVKEKAQAWQDEINQRQERRQEYQDRQKTYTQKKRDTYLSSMERQMSKSEVLEYNSIAKEIWTELIKKPKKMKRKLIKAK